MDNIMPQHLTSGGIFHGIAAPPKYHIFDSAWIMADNRPQELIVTDIDTRSRTTVYSFHGGVTDIPENRVFDSKKELLDSFLCEGEL